MCGLMVQVSAGGILDHVVGWRVDPRRCEEMLGKAATHKSFSRMSNMDQIDEKSLWANSQLAVVRA
jgi:hypothetical protein